MARPRFTPTITINSRHGAWNKRVCWRVHWAELKLSFDQVYVGPRRRHQQTVDAVAAVYRERGLNWPKPVKLPELDEHSGVDVLIRSLPDLIQRDPAIRKMKETWRKDSDTAQRDFMRLYQKVTRMWVRRELHVPDLEAWHEFRDRVSRGLAKIADDAGSKKRVVVFSSAGPVAAATALALGLGDETQDRCPADQNEVAAGVEHPGGIAALMTLPAAPRRTFPRGKSVK